MQIQAGAEDTFIVSSVNGRVVAIFADKDLAKAWISERKEAGVNLRLFLRRTDTEELKPD